MWYVILFGMGLYIGYYLGRKSVPDVNRAVNGLSESLKSAVGLASIFGSKISGSEDFKLPSIKKGVIIKDNNVWVTTFDKHTKTLIVPHQSLNGRFTVKAHISNAPLEAKDALPEVKLDLHAECRLETTYVIGLPESAAQVNAAYIRVEITHIETNRLITKIYKNREVINLSDLQDIVKQQSPDIQD